MRLSAVYELQKEYEDKRFEILLKPWLIQTELLDKLSKEYSEKINNILFSKK